MLLYRLVCQTELCFEQTAGSEKIYCNNSGFYFLYRLKNNFIFPNTVYQRVRKPVSEFALSNGTNSIAKSVSCRITSVKKRAAAPTVLPVINRQKTEYQAAVCQCIFTVRIFML